MRCWILNGSFVLTRQLRSCGKRRRDRFVPCILGGFTPLKGVRYLERAVADLNGAGGGGHAPTGGAGCAVELRIESHVFGAAKEAARAWCDALCLPTLSDNFGLVVAEALERGKFVITTDGAPAWGDLKPCQGIYIKGFRNGSESDRIALLKDAIARGACVS